MTTNATARAVELLQEAISLLSNEEAVSQKSLPTHRVRPDQDQTQLIELRGFVDWPTYREVKNYPLFTFNLGVVRIDGRKQWNKCQAWRETAVWAAENVAKHDEVVVFGTWKQSEWVDKETGELKRAQVFNVAYFGGDKPSE